MVKPSVLWPDYRTAALRQCLADGMTFLEAAASLNAQFGTSYTRSAIGGKAFRIGLYSLNEPAVRKGTKQERTIARENASQARRKPAQTPIHQRVLPMPQFNRDGLTGLRCAEVEPLNLTLLETTGRDVCRWPVNDGRPKFLFCGHPRLEASSYCLDHYELSVGRGTREERRAGFYTPSDRKIA